MFHRRTIVDTASADLISRGITKPVLWCAPNSQTYIILTMAQRIPMPGCIGILSKAYKNLLGHIERSGDGVMQALPNGRIFQLQAGRDLNLIAFNSNNHQTTYGVLASAFLALVDYMAGQGTYCAAAFTIYDGKNEVGTGSIGLY